MISDHDFKNRLEKLKAENWKARKLIDECGGFEGQNAHMKKLMLEKMGLKEVRGVGGQMHYEEASK